MLIIFCVDVPYGPVSKSHDEGEFLVVNQGIAHDLGCTHSDQVRGGRIAFGRYRGSESIDAPLLCSLALDRLIELLLLREKVDLRDRQFEKVCLLLLAVIGDRPTAHEYQAKIDNLEMIHLYGGLDHILEGQRAPLGSQVSIVKRLSDAKITVCPLAEVGIVLVDADHLVGIDDDQEAIVICELIVVIIDRHPLEEQAHGGRAEGLALQIYLSQFELGRAVGQEERIRCIVVF